MVRLLCLLILVSSVPLAAQDGRTLLTFGGPQDDPSLELIDVTGAIRRHDGRITVASGKPLQVRLHDARGRLERIIGSAGDGPGEYSQGVHLLPWSGDSIAVFSLGTRRWLLFRTDGALVREWPHGGGETGGSWIALRGATLVRSDILGSAGCAVSLVTGHPAVGRPGEAFTDAAGRLWRHDIADPTWDVRDSSGRVVGRRTLPVNFRPTHFIGDTIVGVHPDEDGFPIVSVRVAALPPGPSRPAAGCPPATMPESRVGGGAIRTALRNAMTFGEAHKSRHGRYPADMADFPDRLAPNGAELRIVRATSDSWIVAVVEPATGYYCLFSLGPDGVPGMPSGVLHCGG